MEKKAAAVELIKTRLSETPNDPRLWYVLGFFSTFVSKRFCLSLISSLAWVASSFTPTILVSLDGPMRMNSDFIFLKKKKGLVIFLFIFSRFIVLQFLICARQYLDQTILLTWKRL